MQQKNLEDEMLEAIGGETYTGEKIEPGMTVTFTGITPDDYEVSYQDNINVGTARATVTAKAESNNFTGAASASFTIDPKDLSQFTVAPIGEQRHTGEKITPALTVTDPDRAAALIQGLDFTADYENNINVGEAQVTITGTGNYTGTITGTTFQIVATASSFDLTLDKTAWTWEESGPAKVEVSYTSGGVEPPLAIGTDYVLTVDGAEYADMDAALKAIGDLEPGTHTVTAQGKTDTGYAGLSDTVTVTVAKIQPVLEITASPHTLSSAGEVTLTLKGENLPADVGNLSELLTVAATSGTAPDLEKLTWTEEPAGTWTAEVSLPNASNTYTFTLAFKPDSANDKYYESAQATDTVVTAQHTSSGGGGGGQATAFTITASAGTGGGITPAGAVAVVRGGSQSFAITPTAGYEIADVLVDGDSVGAVSSYTFSNVTKNHTITVSFNRTEEIADPDETGVSGWLNTTDHMAYMQGYPGNRFGPDDNMTRAEAAQMFYNLLLDKDVAITASFTDVEESAWYSRAVHVLASLGILEGVGGGLFAPERSITRAEFTAIAMRFADLKTDGDNPFSDVYEDEWFYDVVVGSVRYGWINGYPDGTFRPYDTIARAEAAAATNRMLGRSADRDYVDAHTGSLTQFDDVGTGYWAYYEIMEAANGHTYRRDDAFEDWTGLT